MGFSTPCRMGYSVLARGADRDDNLERRNRMRVVDLRSDTITRPTPSMRRAMAEAEVGDDVFGEDPTVNRLEKTAAERLGKEAALFVPSGTMANLVSLLSHCGRGDEVILGDQSHSYLYEQGGMAALGGIHPRPLRNQPDGTLSLDEIDAAIRPENVHFPRTRLVCLENTHNRCSGNPLSLAYLAAVSALTKLHGLRLHLDGARLFNAAVGLGVDARELATAADSVSFCFSKALGAPAGSVVCGSRDFIAEARRARKVLGGGMRQAGVLAAACLVALEEMVDRLADDHANAQRLAEGLSHVAGLGVDPVLVRTNMVYASLERKDMTSQLLVERLKAEGVLVLPTGPHRIRAVTHYHIIPDDMEYAVKAFHRVMG
jgi:threonine aldolase